MALKISIIKGDPVYDTLPVAKIIHYPLEKKDYKPFAQVRMCRNETAFFIHMLSFEAIPDEESRIAAALTTSGSVGEKMLWIIAGPDGSAQAQVCSKNGQQEDVTDRLHFHKADGEDLQGIYWGMEVAVELEMFERIFGDNLLQAQGLWGNLYKLSDNKTRPHYGSYFPAEFEPFDPMAASNIGEFSFISY